MPQMKIVTENMDSTASSLDAGAGELQAAIANYHNLVQAMVSEAWQSGSGAAFEAKFGEWKVTADRMKENLSELSVFIRGASNNFAQAEAANLGKA